MTPNETRLDPQKVAALTMLLSRLAVHYFRPDFTEGHAKLLIEDYVQDLAGCSVADVEHAIKVYRTTPAPNGKSKYFPDVATLLQIASQKAQERAARQTAQRALPDSRPSFWWLQDHWKPHWQESEIPAEHADAYRKWIARPRATGASAKFK
jgi:hypothetical protein